MRSCRPLKRPPQSLRISGASALSDSEKLLLFSKLETQLLDIAISKKINEVKSLVEISKEEGNGIPLSDKDANSLKAHFDKKLDFYRSQNETKWKHWPSKPSVKIQKSKKKKNFQKRQQKKARKAKQAADHITNSGQVVVLVKEEMPAGAILVLGKGLGFIPSPDVNVHDTRMDMRLIKNKILNKSKANLKKQSGQSIESGKFEPTLPSKLRQKHYGEVSPSKEQAVNEIVESMTQDLDNRLKNPKKPSKSNLSDIEKSGLKWLENMTAENKLAVVEADKGGAILIVYPELLQEKTLEKLNNPSLYEKLNSDPTQDLHKQLYNLWVQGKDSALITPKVAGDVMGVSDNMKGDESGPTNRPSTSPHYKPGQGYFYPSLKIHKMRRQDLVPGVKPPIRLITALQDGISKRSDVYLAETWLKDLEKDFCEDLLQDTTDALKWLDGINMNHSQSDKKSYKCFTYDFKALYDSLSPKLVIEALKVAMDECRPDWTNDFKAWITSLVNHSLISSVGLYDNQWYRQKEGIPTGGSLCVQLANISVYFVLRKTVYTKPELMEHIPSTKRYIDDGGGMHTGTKREFTKWVANVNNKLSIYGLQIDESSIEDPGEFAALLDIQFCFDKHGELQTDLFIKETDSRSYLSFDSSHPNHIFSGIVYSQCLRLRRIINNVDRLSSRLNDLKISFIKSKYPSNMVNNIMNKVKVLKRDIYKQKTVKESSSIRMVTTFGSDSDIVASIKKAIPHLSRTWSFSGSDVSDSSTDDQTRSPQPSQKQFSFVNKTGPSLHNKLVKVRYLAVGKKYASTVPCYKHGNCKCCKMIDHRNLFTVNGQKVKSAGGNCMTYNIIYLIICKLCPNCYVGRTIHWLRTRINEHREKYGKLLKPGFKIDPLDDEFSLGLHLLEHGCKNRDDFDKHFSVTIISKCSPRDLEYQENKFIHFLNTLKPNGLNVANPFALPIFLN